MKNGKHPQTGPRTTEGKAKSSLNALQSGIYTNSVIIPGEDPKELERLKAEYYDRFAPPVPEERDILDQIVRNVWLQRRLSRIEVDIIEFRLGWFTTETDNEVGRAYDDEDRKLARLHRRIAQTEKSYLSLLKVLRALQDARRADEAAQSQSRQPHPAADFVSSTVVPRPRLSVEPPLLCIPQTPSAPQPPPMQK